MEVIKLLLIYLSLILTVGPRSQRLCNCVYVVGLWADKNHETDVCRATDRTDIHPAKNLIRGTNGRVCACEMSCAADTGLNARGTA